MLVIMFIFVVFLLSLFLLAGIIKMKEESEQLREATVRKRLEALMPIQGGKWVFLDSI
jgi:hypothetical protein